MIITYELIIYWMWVIVCEKSYILQSDRVSSDNLPANTKLGASIICNILYALKIWMAIMPVTNRL